MFHRTSKFEVNRHGVIHFSYLLKPIFNSPHLPRKTRSRCSNSTLTDRGRRDDDRTGSNNKLKSKNSLNKEF